MRSRKKVATLTATSPYLTDKMTFARHMFLVIEKFPLPREKMWPKISFVKVTFDILTPINIFELLLSISCRKVARIRNERNVLPLS